jgi:hypothetical protein
MGCDRRSRGGFALSGGIKTLMKQPSDPRGRLDVLFYQLAQRLMEGIERERGITGLQENLLPIVERIAKDKFPSKRIITPEFSALFRLYQQNARRQIR